MQTDGTIPSGANLFRFPRCNRNSTPPLNINYAIRSTKNVFFRFLPLDPSFVSVFQIILSPAFPFAPIFPFFPPFPHIYPFNSFLLRLVNTPKTFLKSTPFICSSFRVIHTTRRCYLHTPRHTFLSNIDLSRWLEAKDLFRLRRSAAVSWVLSVSFHLASTSSSYSAVLSFPLLTHVFQCSLQGSWCKYFLPRGLLY